MTTDANGIPICIAYHKQQNVNVTKHFGDEFFLIGLTTEAQERRPGTTMEKP